MNNFFVLTGGPGAGKTTVLLELEKRGFRYVPEVARQIIQEQVRSGGNALPWGDRALYTRLMLEKSIESYRGQTSVQPLFFDRGIPDTLGYARLIGLADEEIIRQTCSQYRYAPRVFLAPYWEEIYERDTERKQDSTEAKKTCEVIARVYEECGYEILELPKSAAKSRADFILQHLQR